MAPVTAVALVLCWAILVVLFRRQLLAPGHGMPLAPESLAAVRPGLLEEAQTHDGETLVPSSLPLQTALPERDGYLIAKTLLILAALVVFFLFQRGPAASEWRAIGALAGAGLLLCSHRAKAARLYQLVDWNLLLLFVGLFIVNGAMKERQLTQQALDAIASSGLRLDQPVALSAVTLVLSNLVSNVPAVLLLQPSLTQADSAKLWYLLALVSTWAGNLTLVGSIANLIVAESAAAFRVELKLRTYCFAGVPLTLLTVLLGTAWILWLM
jgi:Na+/H+ antiporter NhaD/arsenite permease-like protein